MQGEYGHVPTVDVRKLEDGTYAAHIDITSKSIQVHSIQAGTRRAAECDGMIKCLNLIDAAVRGVAFIDVTYPIYCEMMSFIRKTKMMLVAVKGHAGFLKINANAAIAASGSMIEGIGSEIKKVLGVRSTFGQFSEALSSILEIMQLMSWRYFSSFYV